MGNLLSYYSEVEDATASATDPCDEYQIVKQQNYEEALAACKSAATIPDIHESKNMKRKTYKEAVISCSDVCPDSPKL